MGLYKHCGKNNSEKIYEHFCKLYRGDENDWSEEKILCTFYCPVYQMRLRKPEFISIDKNNTQFYKEVQEQIIKKIEKIGIYIETNPTSNIAISPIESIFSHPIFKLNSSGLKQSVGEEHCALVTINSDDPIIFNTNNQNELAYIYHALVHEGYPKEKILNWMDRVRQMGLDSSFVSQVKLPSTILKEIEYVLENIEIKLKE